MSILLTSKSPLKKDALLAGGMLIINDSDIVTLSVSGSVEQPINNELNYTERQSLKCANERVDKAIAENKGAFDYIVGIENGIVRHGHIYYDICDVVIYDVKTCQRYSTRNMPFDLMIKIMIPDTYAKDIWEVYNKDMTIGTQIAQKYDILIHDGALNNNNWMLKFGIDRREQMSESVKYVRNILPDISLQNAIKNRVLLTQDFPQKGVLFQDYQYVFGDSELFKRIAGYFCRDLQVVKDSYIVAGPELRGYAGLHIAELLKIPHTMIRKSKNGQFKMGGDMVIQALDEKEYDDGKEAFYCLRKTFEGKKVILFDDLLATGGSISACQKLIEQCGGYVVKMCFLADVLDCRVKAKQKMGEEYQKVDVVFNSDVLN